MVQRIAGGICVVGLGLFTRSVRAETITNRADVIAAEIRKEETGWEGDHLTGTWGGLRSKLVDRGIHFSAGYAGEALANVSGGLRRGIIFEGLLEMGLDLDSKKLGLWEGGLLHVSSLYPHGSGLSREHVGDLLTLSNIDAYDSFRLYELWFQQSFFGDKFSVRVGQLLADDEFTYTGPGSYFLNSAFGWPAFISANTVNTGPAFFVAAPGIRLQYNFNETAFVRAGIYDGDSFDSPVGDPRINASGTHVHISDKQGFFAIAEAGLQLNQSEGSAGLPGEFKVGVWMHSGDYSSNFKDAIGNAFVVSGADPAVHSKNYGAYLAAQQMLWREDQDQGLSGFARAGVSPKDRSFFKFVFDGGFNYQGLLPGRDADIVGIGVAYARISRDIRRSERLDAAINGTFYSGFSEHETVLEAFYSLELNKWWTVQPDFQWIFNPGGTGANPDAVVIGLRTMIVF
jgi:porin